VVFDDGLPLAEGIVPGEDPVARAVGARIAQGAPPVQALADAGVRWVLVEKNTGLADPLGDGVLPPTARVVHDGPAVRLVALATTVRDGAPPSSAASTWGWVVTSITWALALGCVVAGTVRRRRQGLIQSAAWLLASER
jgi:hypothetical protein